MRHFSQLGEGAAAELFEKAPIDFDRDSGPSLLASALGATLYTPADRPALSERIARQYSRGARSMVLCLEDAIVDSAVPAAEANLVAALRGLPGEESPLLFVRVRSPQQINRLAERLGADLVRVTGFVFPKFGPANGTAYLNAAAAAAARIDTRLLNMPILESPELAFAESRAATLDELAATLATHRDQVLALRLGATDLCGVFGLRRPMDLTVYDLAVVRGLIADVVNRLGRPGTGHTITGPVWEYFHTAERIFRPGLRTTPFVLHRADRVRATLMSRAMDGLIREVELDKANGLVGKTVIHPTHVPVVHALLTVSHEEYADASDIAAAGDGGVSSSAYGNKMNEARPHANWAGRTLLRARAFGVTAPGRTFVDVLRAVMDADDAQ